MPVSGSVGDAGICSWGFSCPPRTLPLDAARSGGYPHNSRNGHSSKTNLFSVDEAAFAVPTRDLSCDFCDFIRTFFDWNGTDGIKTLYAKLLLLFAAVPVCSRPFYKTSCCFSDPSSDGEEL